MSSEVAGAVSVDGADIERVVEPESIVELRETLAEVNAAGTVCLVGGGTRLAFGNLGGPFDLAISTRKLCRILHYEPDDMTLAVEPGCTIAQIAELLAGSGQLMALDAAHADRATIGGAYATGMSGPRRLGGGSLKDWAIGIETMSPAGVPAKAGGIVVKNVTGYDMMHLHYGALGAFGVITRLNLKVFPSPGATAAVELKYASFAAAMSAAIAIMHSQLQPSSLIVSNADGWVVGVRCDAPSAAIGRQVSRVFALASAASEPEDVREYPDGAVAVAPFVEVTDLVAERVVARLAVRASAQGETISRLVDAFDDTNTLVVADLGSGLVYVASTAGSSFVENIRLASANPTFLKLPAGAKSGVDVFGDLDPRAGEVIRRMKATFDPARTLNRGRFVLGL